ncbi:serine hydrolase domain-containing protein [Snuella sedimenti]|uniref:Beta-lactamase n=1 Tax=Snuella sedimenti TaxID=2798802 RepID=A0A8J7LQI8_9FLAO|nr:serine hydrolase domain-containing protein [Snuella sedimenti]MBJ6369819.1 beta-lactamase family protein [Snuella sedimenti]
MLAYPEICSVSVGFYNKGEKSTHHFGKLTKGKNNTATNSTIFELGSVSKMFTGTLVAKVILEGKINLEDDIRNYLPGKYENLAFEGIPIQIKHLLTHSSRLPHFVSPKWEKILKNVVMIHQNSFMS